MLGKGIVGFGLQRQDICSRQVRRSVVLFYFGKTAAVGTESSYPPNIGGRWRAPHGAAMHFGVQCPSSAFLPKEIPMCCVAVILRWMKLVSPPVLDQQTLHAFFIRPLRQL